MSPASATRLQEVNEDTEITLGTGKMLALFFGLVILCAVFFGMGFTMGKNSVKSTPELLPSPSSTVPRHNAAKSVEAPAADNPTKTTDTPAPQASTPDSSGSTSAQPSDQSATPPPAPGTGYFVQVAAVSKQEDAEALVEALKGHQYSAVISNQPSDKLFHVQVGPFTDIKEAESVRAKLVADGYTPILKK
jgi:DedD protein